MSSRLVWLILLQCTAVVPGVMSLVGEVWGGVGEVPVSCHCYVISINISRVLKSRYTGI